MEENMMTHLSLSMFWAMEMLLARPMVNAFEITIFMLPNILKYRKNSVYLLFWSFRDVLLWHKEETMSLLLVKYE